MRIIFLLAMLTATVVKAQLTIGLIQYDKPNTDGYILFSGISSTETYLIDKCGRKVNQWSSSYRPGLSVSFLTNGELFRTGLSASSSFGSGGGKGGVLEKYNWKGDLLWSYTISDADQCQHHDAIVLPNGNILAIVWDRKTMAAATLVGKNPAVTTLLDKQEVWSEKIIELQPVGKNSANIIWEWKAWDHLVQDFDNAKINYAQVDQHPELLDVNYVLKGPPTNPDWLHINSVDYNPITDQILLSCHNFGEFWIIDHSTTTSQAASHSGGKAGKGGDILYRWGNPITYGRGTVADQKLFKQHHATFIKSGYPNAGKVLVFNNGVNRSTSSYSSIDMIDISKAGFPYTIGATSAYLPSSVFWTYTAATPSTFYAANISGAHALSNGSFLITDGPRGEVFEIDSTSKIKWRYINPVNNTGPMAQGSIPNLNTVFRAEYYPKTYSGFKDIIFTPTTELEINPINPSLCALAAQIEETSVADIFSVSPNPVDNTKMLKIDFDIPVYGSLELLNTIGQKVMSRQLEGKDKQVYLDVKDLSQGVYFLSCKSNKLKSVRKIIVN
jgi:hypothetical protein